MKVALVRRIAVVALAALAPATAHAAEPLTRFSLANGCFTATDASGKVVAEKVRMQATALGRYLLFRPDATFVAANATGTLAPVKDPSPAADFAVQESGSAFTLAPQSTGKPVATVTFAPADGCATFPQAPLNATGTPSKGDLSYGKVGGLLEAHMHWMSYDYFGARFHCGKPWHAYGITKALPDCADIEGPNGTAAPLQNLLNYGNPAQPHSTANYPTLPNQSKDNLTYEGMYYRWVERVWMSGLRMMVMGVNENRVLCELQANRQTNCNEMDTMRRGFKAIRELEDYVDAQSGGPGKGFFQVVTDPLEAREVINEGRMAVVLEMETSEPFDCRGWETSTCDKAQIDRQLDELYRLGVRSSLLLNKFDNPLSGVRFDSGATGYLINAGNKMSAGTFFSARTCKNGELADNTLPETPPGNAVATGLAAIGIPGGTFPAYPPAPHCNTRGLTELGRHVVRRMMDKGMIVNPDHMSQAAVDDTLTLLESRDYSGAISPHGWVDPGNWPRIWKLGGVAFPGHSSADSYVKDYQDYRPEQTPFASAWGYGADLGGLSHQPDSSKKGSIKYPFKSYDGAVTFERQKTGDRTFDYAKEGVAHYGLYADWFEDLRRVGGEKMARDMWEGAEAYLEMWERASGIETNDRCFFHKDGVTRDGRGPLRLGDDWKALLKRAGQPQQRDRAWSWCVKGRGNERAADVAVLDTAGKVELVGTTANGRHARGGRIGRPVSTLRGTRSLGNGLRAKRDGDRTFVYVIRRNRIRAIAITTTAFAAKRSALRTAIARVLTAEASAIPRTFVPAKAQAKGRMLGRALSERSAASARASAALCFGPQGNAPLTR